MVLLGHVSGGASLSRWLYVTLLLVGTLALRYVHHFPPLACNHMTIPGLYSTPPSYLAYDPTLRLLMSLSDQTLSLSWRLEAWLDPSLAFSWSLTRWVHQFAAQRMPRARYSRQKCWTLGLGPR